MQTGESHQKVTAVQRNLIPGPPLLYGNFRATSSQHTEVAVNTEYILVQ